MKYKVGDRVRVKSIEWYNENKNPIGVVWVPEGIAFGNDRVYFCGKIVEIKAAYANRYTIHGSPWAWTDEMFEGLAEEDDDERFKTFLQSKPNLNKFFQQQALHSFKDYVEIQARENEAVAEFLQQISKYIELAPLVKLMREAQGKVEQMDNDTWDEDVYHDMCQLESEVDKRIKELGV